MGRTKYSNTFRNELIGKFEQYIEETLCPYAKQFALNVNIDKLRGEVTITYTSPSIVRRSRTFESPGCIVG